MAAFFFGSSCLRDVTPLGGASAIVGRTLLWRILVAFRVGRLRWWLWQTGLSAVLAALILCTFQIVFLRHRF